MELFRLLGTGVLTASLTALTIGCGAEPAQPATARSVNASESPCDDCEHIVVKVTVDEPNGVFDIDIDPYAGFDPGDLDSLRVEFTRGGVSEDAPLSFTPPEIEDGETETGIALPTGVDCKVDSGLSVRLVYDQEPDLDLAESPVVVVAAP